MSATLFDHADSTGDSLTIYARSGFRREPIAVTINAETATERTVTLTPAAVTRLRAVLAPHDPTEAAHLWAVGDEAIVTEDEPYGATLYAGDRVRVVSISEQRDDAGLYVEFVSGKGQAFYDSRGWYVLRTHLRRLMPEPAAPAIEIGREYRLLPGSTFRTGGGDFTSSLANGGTTRVEVVGGPDSDGDYEVNAIDGIDAKTGGWSVSPRFLAPLETESASEPAAQSAEQLAADAVRALDARRLAAVTAAVEVITSSGTIAGAGEIRELAAYLLGEQTAA